MRWASALACTEMESRIDHARRNGGLLRVAWTLCFSVFLLFAQSVRGTELVLTPDCPSPVESVSLQAFPAAGTSFGRQPLQVTQNSTEVLVYVAASHALVGVPPPPYPMEAVIGPLPAGSYRLSLFQRVLQSDGSLGAAVLDVSRDFVVQPDPPACTPASVSVAPNFTIAASGAPLPAVTALVLDDQGRSVPLIELGWMRVYGPGENFGGPHPDVRFDATHALTDAAGRARITGTANEVPGAASYLVYHRRGNRWFKAYFVVANPGVSGEVVPVVEYSAAGDPDHYFLSADAPETLALDRGAAGALERTGAVFLARPELVVGEGAAPVCRFYGSVSPGPNSHFFTSNPDECAFLIAQSAQIPADQARWNYEGTAFWAVPAVQGLCPGAAPKALYRLYNDGYARGQVPHHRFTTSTAVYSDMQILGWLGEGIAMCLP